jgi:NADH-quinone oxidoreductase subunit L
MQSYDHSFQITLVMLTWLLPLLSFATSFITSDRYSWTTSLSAPLLLFASAISASILLFSQWNQNELLLQYDWFSIGSQTFSANILLSNRSLLMLFVVAVISFLVHLYSVGYMAGDLNIRRYFSMLGFFTFSMQGIILADSLLVIFVFWELVGFSSYLLIGHYNETPEAARASKKAFIMNRVGDVGFLIGLMILWANTGNFNLSEIIHTGADSTWQTYASLCIFCGVIGKSAQFPLFTWLPDAMAGPTPVSALIHAATMVAAGVYLMAGIFPFFTSVSLSVVAIVGAITSVVGALAALSQYDIKKVLAYSTISQLGLMMMAIGMGIVNAALLHLFTHAFFKACLFLCAGSVIHTLHQAQQQSHIDLDVQDIRNMGGLSKKLPWTFGAFAISAASLAGIPFFSGFLSKEAILTSLWMHNNILSWIILVCIITVSILTVVYSFRLLWFVFLGEQRLVKDLPVLETPLIMRVPIVLLAVTSLWFIVSWNPFDFGGWILPSSAHGSAVWLTVASSVIILFAVLVSWLIFKTGSIQSNSILRNAFYVDNAYQQFYSYAVSPFTKVAGYVDKKVIDEAIHMGVYAQVTFAHMVNWVDRIIVDGIVHLFVRVVSFIGALSRSLQRGKIQLYIFWAILAIIIFIICTLN